MTRSEALGAEVPPSATAVSRNARRTAVILPCYYSQGTLAKSLEALRTQTLPPAEVIVVNSSPELETEAVAREYPEVRFVQSERRLFPHAARNLGAEGAASDVLVFSDPDCVADPQWLEKLVSVVTDMEARDSTEIIVGGSMGLASEGWLAHGIHLTKFHRLLPGASRGHRNILPTANVAFSLEAWKRVGPFDGDAFVGDASICWRADQAGIALQFAPVAQVNHHHGESFSEFVKQRVTRGEEFIIERIRWQRWSSLRTLCYLGALPLLVLWITALAGVDAFRAGWGLRFLWTLPIQVLGHGAWNLGEARGLLRGLVRRLSVGR